MFDSHRDLNSSQAFQYNIINLNIVKEPEASLPWGLCDRHPMLQLSYWIVLFLQTLHKQWLLQEPCHD